ncbi:MAG: polysaccharide pyruvyl transferase family protein, partial [Elusimicrobiota bacterium]
NADIEVLSASPSKTSGLYSVAASNRWNPFSIIKSILKCDIMISAGGLYQDRTGLISLYYYLLLIVLAKVFTRKVLLFGVDFTPITHSFNKFVIKIIIPTADSIGVRSQGSIDFLHQIGIEKNITLTADSVMLLEQSTGVVKSNERIKKIGVILKKSRDLSKYVELCNALAGRFDAEIIFIPFHLEEDYLFSRSIASVMSFNSRIARWHKTTDLFNIISDVDFIVSQRLHGLIIGVMSGIPLLGISNDSKLEFFSKEMGLKHIPLKDMDTNVVVGIVNDIWEWRNEFKKLIEKNLPKFKYRAYLNLKKLVDISGEILSEIQ